ncbi:MAG: UDP-N-acetylmuramoyl-tripeptide--D-alanyl-D-alanine ligase [Magnetococcales bacterium]|nr:UDP-N-acetylmuramoyl-tripeptide--D-alanyl-D-alanine ligase [Magnetococcales bacterium]
MQLSFIRAACQAKPVGTPVVGDPVVTGVCTDSRKVKPGELFAALSGPNFDGHDFIGAAVDKGCVAVLAERLPEEALPVPLLLVGDVLTALGDAGRAWRRQVAPVVIGVTGSSGKTTLKELIAACLKERFSVVHATSGNLNNHIGVPLTLLAMPEHCQVAVIEMGMSASGEIAHLARLAEPSIGVVTNVQPAHMAAFASIQAVAAAKGELYAHLPAAGVCVVPDFDANREILLTLAGSRPVLRFGTDAPEALRWQAHPSPDGARQGTILWPDGIHVEVNLGVCGPHMIQNALAAAGVARVAGVGVEAIGRAIAGFQPLAGRGLALAGPQGWTIIDDTYNANPGSMAAALATLAARPAGRRVAILGDMLELGEQSAELHARLAEEIVRHAIDVVLTAGPEMGALHARLATLPGVCARHHHDPANWSGSALQTWLQPGDAILVKGSRGMRMERIVKDLMNHAV